MHVACVLWIVVAAEKRVVAFEVRRRTNIQLLNDLVLYIYGNSKAHLHFLTLRQGEERARGGQRIANNLFRDSVVFH